MRLSMNPLRPCTPTRATHVTFRCCTTTTTITQPSSRLRNNKSLLTTQNLESVSLKSGDPAKITPSEPCRINKRWKEYQGIKNWEGLLDPLDDNLRSEIIRYGHFVEAAYRAFDFDPDSPSYATCRYPKSSLLERAGFPGTRYRITKNLRATSGIRLPSWVGGGSGSWIGTRSSWVGYVAVCQDREEIARLGRRDVVVALRGTATCLEWLENMRATLTGLSDSGSGPDPPMVESGFLSLYTSGSESNPSLQNIVREEIKRLLRSYGDEPLSLTITGHSLGAALATLAAYDIKTTFNRTLLVTVVSFGGPRVGNKSFRHGLEKQGTKILRIVNSDDVITKVPGFGDDVAGNRYVQMANFPQWAYADVGRELRLSSRASPHLSGINVATCHELKTYLHLVNGFVSSACPFRATARSIMKKKTRRRRVQ